MTMREQDHGPGGAASRPCDEQLDIGGITTLWVQHDPLLCLRSVTRDEDKKEP